MPAKTADRIVPAPGETLPLAESVQRARAALEQAVQHLKEFRQDTRYPLVTRSEAEGVITAIREADKLAMNLDPPFVLKA